jgi:hypothetical protein
MNNFMNLTITDIQLYAFDLFIIITYIVYVATLLGITKTRPQYLSELDNYVKIYIALFLIWRFNMFRKIEFTELDRKIVFSSALFLLATTAVNNILITYLNQIKQFFKTNFLE